MPFPPDFYNDTMWEYFILCRNPAIPCPKMIYGKNFGARPIEGIILKKEHACFAVPNGIITVLRQGGLGDGIITHECVQSTLLVYPVFMVFTHLNYFSTLSDRMRQAEMSFGSHISFGYHQTKLDTGTRMKQKEQRNTTMHLAQYIDM